MNRQTLSRAASLVAQSTEWVVLVVLLLAVIPPILIRRDSLTVVSSLNLIDDSWIFDTSYKAAGGILLGRDAAFTYGPLFQWLSSAPARHIGMSLGAVYATWYTLPMLVIVLATFLTARLLLPEATAWRRALLVLLAVVFWSVPDVRVSLVLLSFAVFVRLTNGVVSSVRALLAKAIFAAMICLAAFLFSADTGLYTMAALVLCVAASAIAPPPKQGLARFLVLAAICFTLLLLATNAWMSSLLNFRFWRSSLAIASGYRWFEPIPMIQQNKYLLFKALALGMVVFGIAWWWRNPQGPETRRPVFLMSGFCLAFLMMQNSLVRSDYGHILIGIYPMIFLCGVIVIDEVKSAPVMSAGLPVAAVIATLIFAHPYAMFLPGGFAVRLHQIADPTLRCPEGLQELDHACLSPRDAELLSGVSADVGANTAPGSSIAVFPYETAFGLTSRRQVAGGVLQSYLVNGPYLTEAELAGLRRANPPFALYFPDGVISIAIDGVPNFTRSPEVWFYLLRHYRAEGNPASGVVGLVPDGSRETHLTFAPEKVADPMPPVGIRKRSTFLDLGAVTWPSSGADFVKLRLRLDYPPWWGLRKPSCLTLQMSFADGSAKSLQFVIEPNQTSDVWVYPWDDEELGRYFLPEESQWRPENRPVLVGLKLLVTPFDWISVRPGSVSIESVEAVRVGLQ
jgi:hypothetical protein